MEYRKEYRNGYVVKTRSEGRVSSKLPLLCPHDDCKRLTDSLDDPYLKKFGVCAVCYINYVEDRKQPLIDVEFYKKRLAERGY